MPNLTNYLCIPPELIGQISMGNMNLVKNIVFIAIISIFSVTTKNWEFDLGAGPNWLNLIWITRVKSKENPNLTIESIYKINKAIGYEIDSVLTYVSEEHTYLNAYIDFSYYNFKSGKGCSDTFGIDGNNIIPIEFIEHTSTIKAKSVTLADNLNMLTREYCEKKFTIDTTLGYNYSRFFLMSDYTTRRDFSNSSSNTFSWALKAALEWPNKFNISIQDFIYLSKVLTISSPESLLGIDSGKSYYNLVGNNLLLCAVYPISDSFALSACFNWAYYHNFGKAKIVLSKTDGKLYNNPKLCTTHLNAIGLLFYVNVYF